MKYLILLALSLSACGAHTGLETYDTADYDEPDAAVEADAGPTEQADSGTPEPLYRLGDPCPCCVWAPGTSYPDGEVYCMQGVIEAPVGYMCRGNRGDNAPGWVPATKLCDVDNPWGAPMY